jgi:hypothetical protein
MYVGERVRDYDNMFGWLSKAVPSIRYFESNPDADIGKKNI